MMSLAEARAAAAEALEKVERGADPAAEKKAAKAAPVPDRDTFEAVVADFMKRHATRNRRADDVAAMFRREVAQRWNGRAIQSITKRDILEVLDGIVDRGSPITAESSLRQSPRAIRLGQEPGHHQGQPARRGSPARAREFTGPRSDRSRDHPPVGRDRSHGLSFRSNHTVLLLTGAHLREVAEMTRREISVDGTVWALPAARSKNGDEHIAPLSVEARVIIEALPAIGKAAFVFTTTGATPISGFTRAKERLDRLMTEAANKDRPEGSGTSAIPAFTLHDLRRTIATGVAGLRLPPHVAEAVLNHKSATRRGIASVCNRHDHLEEKREALEAWARHVACLVGEGASNVVAFASEVR